VGLKIGHCGKWIINTWEVLKCGAGEEWRISFGPIVREMEKCYMELRRRGISYIMK
jgi:hypothetical protein